MICFIDYRNTEFLYIKKIKKGDYVNKFAEWMKNNDKKQRSVADKLKISQSSLHDILKKNQMPSLKVAYEIEQYTHGAITMYDWIDQRSEKSTTLSKNKVTKKEKKIKK